MIVSNNANTCENCMINAGVVVMKDIEKAGTYVGVPAKEIEMSKCKLTGDNTRIFFKDIMPSLYEEVSAA